MANGNEGHSRRQVLTTVGSLSIAGAMGQAIASSSLISPAAAAQPNSEIAEKTFEATAENVVNTLALISSRKNHRLDTSVRPSDLAVAWLPAGHARRTQSAPTAA
jgi:hypothetical protein